VVFLRLKVALPLPTRVLMFASDIIMNQTIPFVLISMAIIGGIIYLFKSQKKAILQPLLSLPIIAPLILKIDLYPFYLQPLSIIKFWNSNYHCIAAYGRSSGKKGSF
ncbi:MAG: hypothetical protein V1922_00315, partial [bacterium]